MNVHNLCHVVDDVMKFGALPDISSYKFENFLGNLKKYIRSGNLPLQQISRRILELCEINIFRKIEENNLIFPKKESQERAHALPHCNKSFAEVNFKNEFILANDPKNKWFLTTTNCLVEMIDATFLNNSLYIFGQEIQDKVNFFETPIKSSYLDIYQVLKDHPKSEPKLYSVNDIKCKFFCLESCMESNEYLVFFPLIHSYI